MIGGFPGVPKRVGRNMFIDCVCFLVHEKLVRETENADDNNREVWYMQMPIDIINCISHLDTHSYRTPLNE